MPPPRNVGLPISPSEVAQNDEHNIRKLNSIRFLFLGTVSVEAGQTPPTWRRAAARVLSPRIRVLESWDQAEAAPLLVSGRAQTQ